MKKHVKVILLVCLCFCCGFCDLNAEDLNWECISKEIMEIYAVLVSRDNPKIIYIGNNRGVFKTIDAGDSWQLSLSLRGTGQKINLLTEDGRGVVYAASTQGLFLTQDRGRSWKRIFGGKGKEENDCRALGIFSQTEFYLGTKKGLFATRDGARTWYRAQGRLGNLCILAIACDKENEFIYVAAEDGAYKIDAPLSPDAYDRIFIAHSCKKEEDSEEEGEGVAQETKICTVTHIDIDYRKPQDIYLATHSGIYKSSDYGRNWEAMTGFGLLNKHVEFVKISKSSNPIAINDSGIFIYKKERWNELSLRLLTSSIRFLDIDEQNDLYAATDKGLYKANLNIDVEPATFMQTAEYPQDKPTVQQLHQQAIKYAKIFDPQQFESHKKLSRIKAILPEFSLDYDRTVASYSNSNSTRFCVGPVNWGVTLEWNLGDLIWSEQQRLIDSQTRLMIELRNDILDEVNKLYFEFKRTKLELLRGNPDAKKRAEKELKLEELAAGLDALTGGYFSECLKKNSQDN